MICIIANEPVKRHLEKPMNAQGHLYESLSKGNRQKMERKNIQDEEERIVGMLKIKKENPKMNWYF